MQMNLHVVQRHLADDDVGVQQPGHGAGSGDPHGDRLPEERKRKKKMMKANPDEK